ncbi:hypothetical protein N7462_000129 [Penicillium macrosclerotiorum]|uniref:uncharacterized protein n=1 Tax=Penicillium macrosclerotiorum TaxID=303699 RepID=UPI00254767B8|nr:uncharacterized protein N7462_000129 [Penicillium macrosclerotiorum]KAJ5698124.1 hypothetical protein N7462_000129 [Penicillium macrosclerotiorum]
MTMRTTTIDISGFLWRDGIAGRIEKPVLMQLILFASAFACIFLYHTRHQVPIYHRKFHKNKIYLYVHVIIGILEAFRYRLYVVFQGHNEVLPQAGDILACFVWSWTSFQLVKTLRRGDPRTTRPPYQAGACLRPLASLISYLFSIPCLHRVSIGALDSFIYARLAIFFFYYTPYIRSFSSSTIYAISIPLAATLSIHQSRVPGASLVYILMVTYITRLNEWVTEKSRTLRSPGISATVSEKEKLLISTLIRIGFVELDELRIVEQRKELKRPVSDEYVKWSQTKLEDETPSNE